MFSAQRDAEGVQMNREGIPSRVWAGFSEVIDAPQHKEAGHEAKFSLRSMHVHYDRTW